MPGQLLQRVCASRYLALRVLPAAMRDSVSLVYLLARVTNIIAATSLISAGERFDLLLALRTQLDRGVDDRGLKPIASEVARPPTPPEEKQLLASLKPALAVLARFDAPDRKAITVCLARFIEGAELDLLTFPGEQSGSVVALRELVDLERYTYLVAGNVGEFWTKLAYAHAPRALPGARDTMIRYGVRFGTALRECAKNLRAGRCYLPQALLERAGLNPQDLLRPDASARARPVAERACAFGARSLPLRAQLHTCD
jgi:farnesyl-diphosphate farnesyltransferase